MNLTQKLTTLFSLTLITSCATSKHKKTKASVSHIKASSVVSNYAYESQKVQIDQVIVGKSLSATNNKFLKDIKNSKVDFWVEYFAYKDKERFQRFVNNGEKYRHLIEDTFKKHGLPKELYYVGMIESGYYLHAKSKASAVGPWQFIKSTAQRYGLKVNSTVDERRSIYKSTEAAAFFFQDLYNIFGSWELALSAYNAGEYGIIRRIRKANTRDYYELSKRKKIPKETRHYVPKVLAALKVLKNPQRYGIIIPKIRSIYQKKTKDLVLKKSYSLTELSRASGMSLRQIKKLNTDLKRNRTPYLKRSGYKLKVLSHFKLNNSSPYKVAYKEKRKNNSRKVSTHIHIVKKSENLSSISRKYNIRISNLKKMNNIKSNRIYVGQKLLLTERKRRETKKLTSTKTIVRNSILVRKGDNLITLAKRYKVSKRQIVKMNKLKNNRIYVGQKLSIPKRKKLVYTVKNGDYLGKIARYHGTSVHQIKNLNGLRNKIFPGQKLIVKVY